MTSLATPEPNPFEDVFLFVYYPHNGHISEADDKFIRDVAARNDGTVVGSGIMLVEPYERDIQIMIKRRRAETVARALEGSGYRTETRERLTDP